MPPEPGPCIAVVGATGAVGREVLTLLSARGLAPHRVRALASARSAGTAIPYGDTLLPVVELTADAFRGCAVAIFAADAQTARDFAPGAVDAGCLVVDNSSAFRLHPEVPLVVPEVNGELIGRRGRLIANPNCTTIILLTALEPLRRAFGVRAIDVATYQAVSGAGLAAIDELHDQTRDALHPETARNGSPNGEPKPRVFAEPCAFNIFSHDSAVDPDSGVNGEERKVIDEARKIWNQPDLRVTPTCVRVPVVRAHTEAITVTLDTPATEAAVRGALAGGAGIEIVDDRAANSFPTPRKATERDPVLVGRIRPDPGERPDEHGRRRRWCLIACGDQLRKGAALNAIQIAEHAGVLQPGPRQAAGAQTLTAAV
ncbi:MAG: aspartate-semialdehyde dehydrogenase [Phycisphaerales bacterium]|nr:aspartate-semialdehyde dehydrogenase [Phycisphaerales bacterium]